LRITPREITDKAKFYLPNTALPLENNYRAVVLSAGNRGRKESIEPELAGIIEYPEALAFEDKKKNWVSTLHFAKQFTDTEFIPIKPLSPEPTEKELAYMLCEQGFKAVSRIDKRGSEKFLLGFVFQDGEFFYLACSPSPIPMRLPITLRLTMSVVDSSGTSGDIIEEDKPLTLIIQSYKDMSCLLGKFPL